MNELNNNTYDKHVLNTLYPVSKSESFRYALEINQPFGRLDDVLLWCKETMQRDDWRCQILNSSSAIMSGRYIFYFNDDRDFCAFKLKWL